MPHTDETGSLTFHAHGAQRYPGIVADHLPALLSAVSHLPRDRAGMRLHGIEDLRPFLAARGAIGAVAASVIGPRSRPVRAILFDKTADANWSLGWHQDRTICVQQRLPLAGFGPWTVKGGMQHVAPPFDLLSRMVTLRVHLDDVPASNAPLLIAPGSHLSGRISIDAVEAVAATKGTKTCLADAGDIWLYATPILHASEASTTPARRRVLQVDYAAEDLPGGLEWLGV